MEKGAGLVKSLRGPLCALALLAYHTVVTYVLGKCCSNKITVEPVKSNHPREIPKVDCSSQMIVLLKFSYEGIWKMYSYIHVHARA